MGFIENLRRELEAKRAREEQEMRRAWELQEKAKAEARDAERKRIENLEKCLAASDFPELTEELAKMTGIKVERIAFSGKIYLYLGEKDYLDVGYREKQPYKQKGIEIVSEEDWTIKVRGGLFGPTTLRKNEWYGNRDIQEKALEKAYKHPKVVVEHDPRRIGPGD